MKVKKVWLNIQIYEKLFVFCNLTNHISDFLKQIEKKLLQNKNFLRNMNVLI